MKSLEKLTRHHIIPKSRGGRAGDNIAMVPKIEHRKYHDLFGNMTPREIINYLEKDFWKGKYTESNHYGR